MELNLHFKRSGGTEGLFGMGSLDGAGWLRSGRRPRLCRRRAGSRGRGRMLPSPPMYAPLPTGLRDRESPGALPPGLPACDDQAVLDCLDTYRAWQWVEAS